MDWIRSIMEWAGGVFTQAGVGPLAIPLAFLLGFLSAIVSSCCTLPVLSVIVGYAGMRADRSLQARCISAGYFFLGAALAFVILGGVAAVIGQVAQSTLGRYWKLFAGLVAIFFGLGTLKLLPFRLPQLKWKKQAPEQGTGFLGALLFGLVGGGAVSVCSLACNPGIFIILGAAVLQGFTVWMGAILVAYAIGFSLPLGVLMLGVSFATAAAKFKGADSFVRGMAGVLLIIAGFYFLWTF